MASELIEKLEEQAAPFKPVYHLSQQVNGLEKQADGSFKLTTSQNTVINAKAVIIAAGCGAFAPKKPPLAGIEQYEGTSVAYLVKRREDYRDKKIVIAGGGDSAVDWAISLSELAKKIYVVHRRPKFRCAPESQKQLEALVGQGKVELVTPYQLDSLEGDGTNLTAVNVKTLDGDIRKLEADTLLPFFGLSMKLGEIANWGLNIEKNHITVEPSTCETSLEGVYAIGDIADYKNKLKLILSGFAEAATACHAAHKYVHPDQELRFEYSTSKGVAA
jgi:thioredoxin reductase (NADPH)